MKIPITLIATLIMSLGIFGQETTKKKEQDSVIGVFSSQPDSRTFGQQRARQNPRLSPYKWTHIYVTVKGEKYKVFQCSEDKIKELEDPTKPYREDPTKPCQEVPQAQQGQPQPGQQFQKPSFVNAKDY